MRNILLTGSPGIGKTTVIKKTLEILSSSKISGFYTGEIREGGVRKGFEIRTLDGRGGILSHVDIRSQYRVGKYKVDVRGFEDIAIPELNPDRADIDLIVIDEIGKMECFSDKFKHSVIEALDSEKKVLATIAGKGDRFIQGIKRREDVVVREVTKENRDKLPSELVRMIEGE